MNLTTDPTHLLTKPSQEQQMDIAQQLTSHLQKTEIAQVNTEHRLRQQCESAAVEFTNVRSTHTKEAENQASGNQTYKRMGSKMSVETQVQTDILPRPVAQRDAYDILLSKANDERIKMNRQEKGTQAEALSFHAEV